MKNFVCKSVLSFISVFTFTAKAYIPSSKMIIDKWVENNTTGPIYFEQELMINGDGLSATVKETWYVENESVLAVLVQGEKNLKDKLQFLIQYNGKRRQSSMPIFKTSEGIGVDFFEPLFFMKSSQKLMPFIVASGIVGSDIQGSTNFQRQKDTFLHTPEPFVRLGRTGSSVSYVISGVTGVEAKLPGIWLEQDQFLLRKIRNARETEMSVDKWGNYSRGWKLPKERNYVWGEKSAQAKMLDVRIPQGNIKNLVIKAQEIRSSEFENAPEKTLIEEFYLRFR